MANVLIPTVRGEISSSDLGATLMHEHIFHLDPDIELNYPDGWDEEERIADAVGKLRELRRHGIDSLVDLTVVGLGRNIARIVRIADQVDLNIIVATGVYTWRDLPFQLQSQGPGTLLGGPEPMVEMFSRDISRGIANTGVKAAILKCATDEPGMQPGVLRVLRAVAEVHRLTGVPISTHANAILRRGLEQQQIFAEEKVDLSRVIIGHSGDTDDFEYLYALMAAGSCIGMDRFGAEPLSPTMSFPLEKRVETVARLCADGYANRMVLSHDNSVVNRWVPRGMVSRPYLTVSEVVLPALRARGVSEHDINQMLIDNPRRIFEATAETKC